MTTIDLPQDFILGLLTEINKHRVLADHETDIIERIVCRGHRSRAVRIRWTVTLDLELSRMALRRGGVRAFADKHGFPPQAAYDRLHKLRKAKSNNNAGQGRREG